MPDSWRFILRRSFRGDSVWTWIFLLTSLAEASLTYVWIRAGIGAAGNQGPGLPIALLFGVLVVAGFAIKTVRRWSGMRLDMLLHSLFEIEILKLPVFCDPATEHQTIRYRALWNYTGLPFQINLLTNNLLTGTLSLSVLLTPGLMICSYVPFILILTASVEFILSKKLAIREHQFELSQSDQLRELSQQRIGYVNHGGGIEALHKIINGQAHVNSGIIEFEKKRRRLILVHRIPQALALCLMVLAYTGTNHRLTDLPVIAIAAWKAWQAIASLAPAVTGWVRVKELVDECYKVFTNQTYEHQNDTTIGGGGQGPSVPYKLAPA